MPHVSRRPWRRFPALWLALGLATMACKPRPDASQVASSAPGAADAGDTSWWEGERAQRQAALDSYLTKQHAADFAWFRDWPLGYTGTPYLMFRLFPIIFPDIWGDKEHFGESVGLMKHPDPSYPFPLGIGWIRSSKPIFRVPGLKELRMNVTNFTCATCHSSRVRKEDGTFQVLYGAPSNEFDAGAYATAFDKTIKSPKFTYESFARYIDTARGYDVGWFYGKGADDKAWELFERKLFIKEGQNIVAKIKAAYVERNRRVDAIMRDGVYNAPDRPSLDGGHPGSLDAMGLGVAKGMPDGRDPALWPKNPAFVDIMSVWRQKDRPVAQWTASMTNTTYRNLGAEVGVIGDPELTNFENSQHTSRLLDEMPAPPYPFKVRKSLADRGKPLYERHCAQCHRPGNSDTYPAAAVGTDPNRLTIFNATSRADLIAGLRKACTDKRACAQVPDEDILKAETGYMAVPLDGIWARAPYLHNGSVPTLRHLLVPSLRESDDAKTFWRGNPDYDQKNVGWVWDRQMGKNAKPYRTAMKGFSNQGHVGEYLRADGKAWEGEELEALLEYLKTL